MPKNYDTEPDDVEPEEDCRDTLTKFEDFTSVELTQVFETEEGADDVGTLPA